MHFYYLRFYAPTAYAVGYILPPLRGWATEQTDDYVVAAGTTVADAVVALTADAFMGTTVTCPLFSSSAKRASAGPQQPACRSAESSSCIVIRAERIARRST